MTVEFSGYFYKISIVIFCAEHNLHGFLMKPDINHTCGFYFRSRFVFVILHLVVK